MDPADDAVAALIAGGRVWDDIESPGAWVDDLRGNTEEETDDRR